MDSKNKLEDRVLRLIMTTINNIRSDPSVNAARIYKARKTIKNFWQSVNNSKRYSFSEDQIELIQQISLEFLCSGRSINELIQTLTSKGIPITRYLLESFLETLDDLLQAIITQIDQMVAPFIAVIEADETFKGDDKKFFEAMDHCSGYVLEYNLIEDASFDTLYPHYKLLLERFPNIQFIITDLARVYPNIVSKLNSDFNTDIEHIQCQVHDVRNILKEMLPISLKYKKEHRHLRSLKKSLEEKKTKKWALIKSIHYHHKKLNPLIQQRDRLQRMLGVRPYQKNILSQHPQLKTLNVKINSLRSTLRGKEHALQSYKNKIYDLQREIVSSEQKKKVVWYEYITHRKMFKRFIDYCKHSIGSLKEFADNITHYRKKSCKHFASYLVRFAKQNSKLFTLHKYLNDKGRVNRLISTNRIESFNNLVKRYKDIRRTWKDTKITSVYTRLLRLYFNLMRRLNNNGENASPIERLGFSLNGASLYTLIFKRFRIVHIGVEQTDFKIETSCGQLTIKK